ncbi:MAG: ribonuclease P protein component [Planctomycetes bacterium]|nr:ribonuclease P protein component [Planctomycetota bacterium]
MGVPREGRLRSGSDFRSLYRDRRMLRNRDLTIYWRLRPDSPSRLGLSVGKRVGDAVRRNRCKRVLREVFRLEATAIPGHFDFIVIPRPGEQAFDFHQLRHAFVHLMGKLAREVERTPARRDDASP